MIKLAVAKPLSHFQCSQAYVLFSVTSENDADAGNKYFKMSEVATHNTTDSLWLVIDNKVYDITSFPFEHPGGEQILYEKGGSDATTDFEDVGHSSGMHSNAYNCNPKTCERNNKQSRHRKLIPRRLKMKS